MQLTRTVRTETPLATMSQREITAIEASVARTLRSSVTPLDSLEITRSLIREVIAAFWKQTQARLLDPACGGAFLSPLALRMAASQKDQPAEAVLTSIESRLRGYEIDPFAA